MADLTPREELESIYSDVSKDAYGFRDRRDLSGLTDEELSAEIADLNAYGWREELSRAAHEAGEEIAYTDLARMTVAEMAHRTDELRARANTRPTEGPGWRLS